MSFGEKFDNSLFGHLSDKYGRPEESDLGGLARRENQMEKSSRGSLQFGQALIELQNNKTVARSGWNGKGMWLALQQPYPYSKMTLPYIYMRTAQGDLVPWLASQTDVLANDWYVLTQEEVTSYRIAPPAMSSPAPVSTVPTSDPQPYQPQTVMPEKLLQFFGYKHLPPQMQETSRLFSELAEKLVLTLPSNPERTVALRKLLESKDCAVRARIFT